MKTMKTIFALAAVMVAFVGSASAQMQDLPTKSDELRVRAGATIVSSIGANVDANEGMIEFGQIIPSNTEGTVTIRPMVGGGRMGSGVHFLYGITPHAAKINISAPQGVQWSVFTQTQTHVISNVNTPGNDMEVSDITFSAARGVMDNTGSAAIYIGGTLAVQANQAAGRYESPVEGFPVIISYE